MVVGLKVTTQHHFRYLNLSIQHRVLLHNIALYKFPFRSVESLSAPVHTKYGLVYCAINLNQVEVQKGLLYSLYFLIFRGYEKYTTVFSLVKSIDQSFALFFDRLSLLLHKVEDQQKDNLVF